LTTQYEYYNTNDDSAYTLYGVFWQAQTFTVGATGHPVTSIKVKLYRYGSPGTGTISIRATSSGLPTGSDLTSTSVAGNSLTTDPAGAWYEYSVTEITLTANTKYAIVLRFPSGNTSNWVRWRADYSGSPYTNGDDPFSINSGVSWTADTVTDMMFEIWGNPLIYSASKVISSKFYVLSIKSSSKDISSKFYTYTVSASTNTSSSFHINRDLSGSKGLSASLITPSIDASKTISSSFRQVRMSASKTVSSIFYVYETFDDTDKLSSTFKISINREELSSSFYILGNVGAKFGTNILHYVQSIIIDNVNVITNYPITKRSNPYKRKIASKGERMTIQGKILDDYYAMMLTWSLADGTVRVLDLTDIYPSLETWNALLTDCSFSGSTGTAPVEYSLSFVKVDNP